MQPNIYFTRGLITSCRSLSQVISSWSAPSSFPFMGQASTLNPTPGEARESESARESERQSEKESEGESEGEIEIESKTETERETE